MESRVSLIPPFLNLRASGLISCVGTVARRLSIHRATTVGPKSPLCQVILKNTTTVKDTSANSNTQINRSQSLLTTNARIPVLAPSRGDRARLEAQLAAVWSRKVLPFPGITSRSRSERLVRSSASTVMRKLSVASITNSFAKHSTSNTSVAKANEDETANTNGFGDSAHLNGDKPRSAGISTAEGDVKRRLPMIKDETEHTGSNSPSIASTNDTRSRSGTVKKLDPSKLDLEWLEEGEATTPSLQTSAPSSIRRSRQMSLSAISSLSSAEDEENMYHGFGTKHRLHETLTNIRPTSKWPRMGAINRGLMASSIRSFFR